MKKRHIKNQIGKDFLTNRAKRTMMITTLTTTSTTHRCAFQPSRKSGVVCRNRCRRVFANEDDDEEKVVAEIENAQREKEEEEDEEEEMMLLNARNQTFEDAVVMMRGGGGRTGGKEDWEEMEERNVWKTKPVWCQPWTIVLTGMLIISLPTLVFDWKYVSVAFAFPIAAWWYIFLYAYPKSFREGGM